MLSTFFDAITPMIAELMKEYGLLAIFLGMIVESACIPLPSEIIMPLGGVMVLQGSSNIWLVALAGTIGNLVGGSLAYFAGKSGGRKFILKYGPYIKLSAKHLNHAEAWFKKRGEATVFWSRLIPGVRTFISLPAGIAHMNFWRFAVYTTLGSFPWALALAYAGYYFGTKWDVLTSYLHEINYILWALMIIAAILYLYKRKKRLSKERAN